MISTVSNVLVIATASLGLTAYVSHRRFGAWYHTLYALTVLSMIPRILLSPSMVLLPMILGLTLLPLYRGGSKGHVLLGMCCSGAAVFDVMVSALT
ncbi:MAG TPA: hypothetical protein PLW14_04435 [Chlorobiota bacterium]|nr:hypothetical protein [Chlorobiota bacterium]